MSGDKTDPNGMGPDGLPIIFWIIERNELERVRQLLDAGANIESRGFGRATPALAAAIPDTWTICLLLLRRGANPWASNHAGFTIAYLASTSKVVNPKTEEFKALQEVRLFLKDRGLYDRIYRPEEVKALNTAGRWPPAEGKGQR